MPVDWISRSEFGLKGSVIDELVHLESQGYYFLRHIAHDTDTKVRREYGGWPYYEAVKREPDGEKQCHVVFH